MKYIKRFITLPAVASAILFGCITEFEPKGIEEVSDLIVIDGTITDGETRVTLRYSVGLTENLTGSEYLYGADVYVETDGGETFPAYYEMTPSVTYVIPNGDLDANKQYRLNVVYGGKHYQSSFLAPMVTPAIDSISAQKAGTGQPVYMCVNTHDPANRSNYYRWSYREDWEFTAELYSNARLENKKIIYHDAAENTYYCWNKDNSKTLLLGSTEKLSSNIVSQKKLAEIDPKSTKLSFLYRIQVDQMQIRKEAYDYFYNLQKNVEQTGSLFTPMPSEMKGNIECLTDPSLPVIGYIEVTTTAKAERYFARNAGLFEATAGECYLLVSTDTELHPERIASYNYYEYYPPDLINWIPKDCVDCRTRGSKTKPAGWPNDHQ